MLDLGTTPRGNEVFINQEITASDYTTVVIQRVFSLVAATTLYLNDDTAPSTWNGATVDAYFVFTPVIPGGTLVTGNTILSYYETDCSCDSPTIALLNGLIGLASNYTAGSVFLIKDTNGGCAADIYFAMTDGTAWHINSASFSLAL